MNREYLARLARVEKALERSEISDAELLQALANRDVHESHLLALYDRIESAFHALVICTAGNLRLLREQGDEVGIQDGFLWHTAAVLSFEDDEQMPAGLKECLTGSGMPQDARYNPILWMGIMHAWLARHLVRTRGGIEALRREVTQRIHDGPAPGFIPIYSDEEAAYLMQFVSLLEAPDGPWDLPVLLWCSPDRYLCVSRKGDITGQNWTRLSPVPEDPD